VKPDQQQLAIADGLRAAARHVKADRLDDAIEQLRIVGVAIEIRKRRRAP